MNRCRSILVYVDTLKEQAPAALPEAKRLAKADGALVKVVDVLEDVPWYATVLGHTLDEIRTALSDQKSERLRRLVEPCGEAVQCTQALLRGSVHAALLQELEEQGHDLVVKSALGDGSVRRRVFGDTAMHLLRKSSRPVWLVSPHRPRTGHVVAAIDPVPGDEAQNSFQTRILLAADRMAQLLGGGLSVVHAWTAYGETLFGSRVNPDELTQYLTSVRRQIERFVTDFVRRVLPEWDPATLRLIKGDPRDVIPEYLVREEAELLVLGTMARSGIAGFVLGNTAEALLSQVQCSVLALKPSPEGAEPE